MRRSVVITIAAAPLIGTVAFPSIAAAEVMDKEPTLVVIWAWALIGGSLGIIGWRFRWWVGAALALLPAGYFLALRSEITDPYVAPAIIEEAGYGYVRWSYYAAAVFIALHAIGVWRAVRRPSQRATVSGSGPAAAPS